MKRWYVFLVFLITSIGYGQVTFTSYVTGFSDPRGLAFDLSGNLLVCNTGASTLCKVTPGKVVSTIATLTPYTQSVAVDKQGNMYAALTGGSGISKVTSAGVVSSYNSTIPTPVAVTFNASGDLMVTSYNTNAAVHRVKSDGTVIAVATDSRLGGAGTGVSDNFNNYYVANYSTATLYKVDSNGTVTLFASNVGNPFNGSVFGSNGWLFIGDFSAGVVRRISINTGKVDTVGTVTGGAAGIALDKNGYMYVSSRNGAIYVSATVVAYPADYASLPTVNTPTTSNIQSTTATLGATIADTGSTGITQYGIVWDTVPNPTNHAVTVSGSPKGSFTVSATGLPAGSLIHFRGFADNSGGRSFTSDTSFTTSATGVESRDGAAVPHALRLDQNYPNPFNPATQISFSIERDGRTILTIYDMLGRKVATLMDGDLRTGIVYRVNFNASKLSSGVYYSCLESGGKREMKKLVLVK